MKKILLAALGVILIAFLISAYFYQQMPETMASHWNVQGEVDGYMPKVWALFLMPLMSVVLLILFIFLPKIDPLKKNIEKFLNYYEWFILIMIIFLFYIHMLTLLFSLGIEFNMTQALVPALGILIFYLGAMMKNSKRNWFIGIRTPWTLSSDVVWEKTNILGGKLFQVAGGLVFLTLVVPDYGFWLMILPLLAVVVFSFVYSYLEFKKEIAKLSKK